MERERTNRRAACENKPGQDLNRGFLNSQVRKSDDCYIVEDHTNLEKYPSKCQVSTDILVKADSSDSGGENESWRLPVAPDRTAFTRAWIAREHGRRRRFKNRTSESSNSTPGEISDDVGFSAMDSESTDNHCDSESIDFSVNSINTKTGDDVANPATHTEPMKSDSESGEKLKRYTAVKRLNSSINISAVAENKQISPIEHQLPIKQERIEQVVNYESHLSDIDMFATPDCYEFIECAPLAKEGSANNDSASEAKKSSDKEECPTKKKLEGKSANSKKNLELYVYVERCPLLEARIHLSEDKNVKSRNVNVKHNIKLLTVKLTRSIDSDINDNQPEKYKCSQCMYLTQWGVCLILHIKVKHNYIPGLYSCRKCTFKTEIKELFHVHMRAKHNWKFQTYQCRNCSYSTIWKAYLPWHTKTKHNSRPLKYKCKECSYATRYTYYLDRHQKLHHGLHASIYRCCKCQYATYWKPYLAKHLNKHESDSSV